MFILVSIFSFFVIKNFNKEIIIPEEAIRFRIIANSNSIEDQNIKIKVRNNLEKELAKKMSKVKEIDDAKNILKNSIKEFNNIVDNTLKDNNYDMDFNINYGYNYFPEKIYNGVKYREGNYNSLVVTLGSGKGDNWWCVLFPPLCLVEIDEENTNEVEYRFFIKDLIDKYF